MQQQDQWSSKLGFILAAAGSAIGLGAIWKFPYMAGTNGGGVFFLLFILFTALIGAPILLAEFLIGRRTQKDAISSFKALAPGTAWPVTAVIGVVAAFVILSFYSVVGGWVLSYMWRTAAGGINGNADFTRLFGDIISNPAEVLAAQAVFMVCTILVVQGGVQKGIERASTILMPALFLLFLALVIRSLTLPGASEGVRFLLSPDWSYLNAETALTALGQAFFALSLGVSVMVTYASYLDKQQDLTRSALSVAGLNIFISLLAGLVIFPAVFAFGFEPNQGPGLVFIVLPAVFVQLPFGSLFFFVFLVLLLFATLTSAFSILEIVVASVTKQDSRKRKKAAWLAGLAIFLTGIPSALSFGPLQHTLLFGKTFFDLADFLTSSVAMPVGAFFIAVFTGFYLKKKDVKEELFRGSSISSRFFEVWYVLLKFAAPAAILFILLQSMGFLD